MPCQPLFLPVNEIPLSEALPGTWDLLSRIDIAGNGERRVEPSLGEDPIAWLIYDRSGHFAAQFMRRDRSGFVPDGPAGASNNSRAQGGYDAYFGTYTIDDASGTVVQTFVGSLSVETVGFVVTRSMQVVGDTLIIKLETMADGQESVMRTLTWRRIG